MTCIHTNNFMFAFGFTTPDSDQKKTGHNHLWSNLVKLSSYVPLLGTITTLALAILLLVDKLHDKNSKYTSGEIVAMFARAALTPAAFLVLLPLDIIGSIFHAVKKHQNGGIDPLG